MEDEKKSLQRNEAIFISVRNKAPPVVRDNQNLWRTINSYYEVVRSDNQLF